MAKEKVATENTVSETVPRNGRSHKATYSRDKKNPGKYLVRVVGPHATQFEGRTIPVSKNDGSEENETLLRAITSGIDNGQVIPADKGQTWCLYKMVEKPKADYVPPEF